MKKKAVVFGGSGFLGSHVADVLLAKGLAVTVFDRRPSPYIQEKQEMIVGDILDPSALKRALRNCNYVFHFAGFADLDEAATKPLETIQQNVSGTANLLAAAADEEVERFVYASTIYVNSALGGFYRCSKQAAELYVEEFQRQRNLDYTILRYGTLYGPRADKHNSLWRYLRQALEEKKITFKGTGEEIREYIHVLDAARLTANILSDEFANQRVTITGHHPMKAGDMLKMIKEIMNDKIKIEFDTTDKSRAHYNITPYTFLPKPATKLVSNRYMDMGQGILESLAEIYRDIGKPAAASGTKHAR